MPAEILRAVHHRLLESYEDIMISESTISKVRELAIEDVLKPYVSLSRKGSTLMGLCPFHAEKTGSFAVSPHRNLFHCFSCNRGGDAITFIMEKENLSFIEAVRFIAENAEFNFSTLYFTFFSYLFKIFNFLTSKSDKTMSYYRM